MNPIFGTARPDLSDSVTWSSDYLMASTDERRQKIETLIQEKGPNNPDVITLLQTACRQDPDPGTRKWALGQLQDRGVTPPSSEWPSTGNDGKVYTREALATVENLFVCDPVSRSGFLQKPGGHIKVPWNSQSFLLLPIGLFFTIFDGVAIIGLSVSKNKADHADLPIFALMLLVGLAMVGYLGYRLWQLFQKSRDLEKTGQLYLGQFKTVHEGREVRGSSGRTGGGRTGSGRTIHYYQFAFIFTTSAGQIIESTRRVYGKRPDIQSALPLRLGTPLAVLYSPSHGFRLL